MKKFLIAAGASLLLNATYAQNGKVTSAWSAMQTYLSEHDLNSLENGLPYIDAATKDSVTSKSTKAWWYRAQLYLFVSIEKDLKAKYPDASIESLNSFQKMLELNDPKFKGWSDANERMVDLARTTFNEGADQFGQKEYAKSAASFLRVVTIDSMLKLKGGKMPTELSVALDYSAAAAQNANDLPKAEAITEQLIAKYPDSSKYYHSLYRILVSQEKKAEAVAVVDRGLAKFPADKDLLVDKVNSFFSENKPAEAIEYLKKLVEQDPKNEQLVAALGVAYENAGNSDEAVKAYQSLIDLNPNSYEGNYGRGTILFAKAKAINDQMNALGNTKADYAKYDSLKIERDKIFVESKPYFEKALAAKPDDSKAKQALTQIELLAH